MTSSGCGAGRGPAGQSSTARPRRTALGVVGRSMSMGCKSSIIRWRQDPGFEVEISDVSQPDVGPCAPPPFPSGEGVPRFILTSNRRHETAGKSKLPPIPQPRRRLLDHAIEDHQLLPSMMYLLDLPRASRGGANKFVDNPAPSAAPSSIELVRCRTASVVIIFSARRFPGGYARKPEAA